MKVQVQFVADSGKHDDTAAMKTNILKIIPQDCLRVLGGDASLESYFKDIKTPDLHKIWRGFGNILTALFLCPVDHLEVMKTDPDAFVNTHIQKTSADSCIL